MAQTQPTYSIPEPPETFPIAKLFLQAGEHTQHLREVPHPKVDEPILQIKEAEGHWNLAECQTLDGASPSSHPMGWR